MASKKKERGPPPHSRSWQALTPPLSEWILDAVAAMGFTRMTPVQASTIPLFMGHKDVVVEAVTGSGKTMAFLIPVVEKLLRLEAPIKKHHVGAIIVSPTRELAEQIYKVLLSLLAFHAPSAAAIQPSTSHETADGETILPFYPSSTLKVVPQLLLGGATTPAQDLSTFLKRSPNLFVSTPGRLLELLSSPHVHCPQTSFEVLVLDEADRLLDLGFKDDLQKILARLPKQRRTGLFSATVSDAVDQIIRVGLRNPVKIAVKVKGAPGTEEKRTPASLQMTYLLTRPSHKIPAIRQILNSIDNTPQKTILYFSTCAAVDYWSHVLPSLLPEIFVTLPLHGKHPPNVRQKNFSRFTNSVSPSVLLTTDVAARGLDIPLVDLVIQFDPPTDPKAYLHRCGRAGRAGRRGLSVILLCPGREEDYIPFLEVRKTPVSLLESPPVALSDTLATEATSKIRETVLRDRALHDKAQKAFVSWVRSYTKHQASSIFRITDIDWEEAGRAWGLLKLPKMPELQKFSGDRTLGVTLDWDKYSYKDKQREKHRQESLNSATTHNPLKRPAPSSSSNNDTAPWSKTLEKKSDKEKRRERKRAKKEREHWEKMTEEEKTKSRETRQMLEELRKKNRQELNAKSHTSSSVLSKPQEAELDGESEFEGFD
ncbi:ATP-dependent rRNA helicase spb4, putative [Coccidioides posadasii C735 delta SOWgp]|uniref:ATP-dependent RNA helicase n=1 Tax=Coccidioides posadasii (strain C735) TaxID=222929 RepID=C5PA13_COCP7|nr:ATP-dependent rRNA helicase spb4, putative [Coccidioides posadasii C735 delta SOWgp]EER26575.1 ATP-dependent rRNA helicase spb4, putative [Coccidioides posadasii C735 delta SOWgp]|eukprot:XP_003068720.1 ATP-dependent rRNA helicase spb4, putative [Coccidioides posadasii C735 delta SOWgp]